MDGMKKIESITVYLAKKWWFYLLILILFFLPSYSTKPVNPQEISLLIIEVLKNPFIHIFEVAYPVLKVLFIIAIIFLIILKEKISYYFTIYITILLFIISIFQNMGLTETYGFSAIIGNIIIQMVVVIFWVLELFIKKNRFSIDIQPLWKWWVIPFALLAFWMPMDINAKPDFNPLYFFTNESILTYCMITPVIIAILTLYFPNVNIPTLRVMSYVGFLFGIMNILTWFIFNPSMWWMGVLHIPLFTISIYGFLLTLFKRKRYT